jgi:hypothetical protein
MAMASEGEGEGEGAVLDDGPVQEFIGECLLVPVRAAFLLIIIFLLFFLKIHSQIRNENAPVRLGLRLHKFGRIESTIIPRRIYSQSTPPIRQISHFYVSTLLS